MHGLYSLVLLTGEVGDWCRRRAVSNLKYIHEIGVVEKVGNVVVDWSSSANCEVALPRSGPPRTLSLALEEGSKCSCQNGERGFGERTSECRNRPRTSVRGRAAVHEFGVYGRRRLRYGRVSVFRDFHEDSRTNHLEPPFACMTDDVTNDRRACGLAIHSRRLAIVLPISRETASAVHCWKNNRRSRSLYLLSASPWRYF